LNQPKSYRIQQICADCEFFKNEPKYPDNLPLQAASGNPRLYYCGYNSSLRERVFVAPKGWCEDFNQSKSEKEEDDFW